MRLLMDSGLAAGLEIFYFSWFAVLESVAVVWHPFSPLKP